MKRTEHASLHRGLALATAVTVLSAGHAAVFASPVTASLPADDAASTTTMTADPVVSVAGDIACAPTIAAYKRGAGTAKECRQKYTSNLILGSDEVWTLGDHLYPIATTKQFRGVYGPTWGRMKAVTYPSPGDHDYGHTAGRDYYAYFDVPRYYAFRLGGWRVFSLNSEINHSINSAQVQWLRHELASTRATCIAAFWGATRWTSGIKSPGDRSFDPFWRALYAARADLALGGDVHNYERFAKQTPAGVAARSGIRQFVVGTGGRSLTGFPTVRPNSQAREKAFGVLKLTLHAGSYDWRFVSESKRILDSGSKRCH